MIPGYCYHCQDCQFNSLFQEPSIQHSRIQHHAVIRRFRDNCLKHNPVKLNEQS